MCEVIAMADEHLDARQIDKSPDIEALPLLIPAAVCAKMCGVSRSHWHVLLSSGRVPASIKLGRKRLWNKADILEWISHGCPDGKLWSAMQASKNRRLRVNLG
jgi:predicted DNA-binding transcriptional regulator AlpA